MKLYIALPNTYFDNGTEVDLVDRIDAQSALFFGLRGGKFDEAVCKYKEFKVRYVADKDARSIGGENAETEFD